MSRRKQAKPQHVEFDENKNNSLTGGSVVAGDGEIKQLLRHTLLDKSVALEINGLGELTETSLSDVTQTGHCNGVDPAREEDQTESVATEDTSSTNQTLPTNLDEHSEGERSSPMELPLSLPQPQAGRDGAYSAGTENLLRGEFAPTHRSLLYPKFSSCINTPKRPNSCHATQRNATDEVSEHAGNLKGASEEVVDPSRTTSGEALESHAAKSSDASAEMYSCGRCGDNFTLLCDFVQHKKTDCGHSPNYGSADEDETNTHESYPVENKVSREQDMMTSTYDDDFDGDDVTMKTVPYAAQGGSVADGDDARDQANAENGDDDAKRREAGDVMLESLNGTRVAVAQSVPGDDSAEHDLQINEDDYEESNANSDCDDRPCTPIEDEEDIERSTPEAPQNTGDADGAQDIHDRESQTEKLRKEILAAEAMAQAIQSMTAFAAQTNGGESGVEKPEINAIKNQVRMIQQQQAYQVQMLSFLQWQLALASSNPQQAAMAAAAAAGARNGGMTNGFGMNPQLPPQLFPGAAAGLMPQMMAAMAMNSLQKSDSNGMADFAKARLMMSMQQNAAENAHNFRSLFSRSLQETDGVTREDHEQRYQLKDPKETEGKEPAKEVPQDSPESQMGAGHTGQISKSDSGYDDDGKSMLLSNGTNMADDASSSHGSQEDGELRDGVLKATAEEHRHRCRFCHKVFGSDSALQIHIRSHTGERPYKCNICGNRFTTKGNLKVHFMRHKSKYPHIPMNSHPVPEYLDHIPTSNGVPYGMSILPEKAVLERPRLHGNPSIHINPQQAAAMAQREAASHGLSNLFMSHLNPIQSNGAAELPERSDMGIPHNMGPADVASVIQAQLLQRRRAEYLESQWNNNDENKGSPRRNESFETGETKTPMSALQAAMLPFLPSLAARQQLEGLPPHLRYLLPHHLQALQGHAANGGSTNSSLAAAKFLAGAASGTPPSPNKQRNGIDLDKTTNSHSSPMTPSSETSKLQRLVENIDRGRVLQKNECHICHRILSCQSALKLHYRTHTGERPYKCDLCSRAFTTRGNLRTHYSSVHRQQMRPIPPGGSHATRLTPPGSFPCSLCPARFREPVEYQQHMQMHAMVQAQQQQQRMAQEHEKHILDAQAAMDLSDKAEDFDQRRPEAKNENGDDSGVESRESSKDMTEVKAENEENETPTVKTEECDMRDDAADDTGSPTPNSLSRGANDRCESPNEASDLKSEGKSEALDLSSPAADHDDTRSRDSNDSAARFTPPASNPLDPLAALSNLSASAIMPQHTGSMLDHQLAALSRARAGSLTVCEICEKPFSCQSALEIHLRTHTKERPFMCRICQRAFTTKGNLKQHLLTHNITDIPEQMLQPVSSPRENNSASNSPPSSPPLSETASPFVIKRPADMSDSAAPASKRSYPRHWCHICQKQFSSASSLQIHNRTHTGEKPFACSVCGRAFTTKGNLKVHMGTHVWGAGGSRRGRRISMDNPLISPWMKNMRPRPPQNPIGIPTTGHVTDPAALYQQYAAIANGLLTAKQDATARLMLPLPNGHPVNSASPASSSGSPLPSGEVTSPQSRVNGSAMPNAMSAATEWFLKAYQRTQEQVN